MQLWTMICNCMECDVRVCNNKPQYETMSNPFSVFALGSEGQRNARCMQLNCNTHTHNCCRCRWTSAWESHVGMWLRLVSRLLRRGGKAPQSFGDRSWWLAVCRGTAPCGEAWSILCVKQGRHPLQVSGHRGLVIEVGGVQCGQRHHGRNLSWLWFATRGCGCPCNTWRVCIHVEALSADFAFDVFFAV